MTRKCHVRFGGGSSKKGGKPYLVGGLPYFQGNVHAIGEGDYRLIREALEARVPLGTGGGDGRGGG